MKLIIFILMGNAIVIQAILYPDYPLITELIRKSFHKAMVIFYITPVGELTAGEPNCVTWAQKPSSEKMCRVSNYVDGKCSDGINFWAYLIVFQFVLLMKLVLMTILFALFNATGARIGAETDSIWKFQRYKLVIKFSNTLRLPPPLNIFSVLIFLCKFLISCCKKGESFLKSGKHVEHEIMSHSDEDQPLSSENFAYWRQLASEYLTTKTMGKEEDKYVKRELDILSELCEDLQIKETRIYRSIVLIRQIESDICFTHAELETLKHRARKEDSMKITLHSLSRESPYPQTKVNRFLVPDKYVPWEVKWVNYKPPKYSMPKKDFPEYLQSYVDEDVAMKNAHDKKMYYFNSEAIDNNGVYRNRISWIVGFYSQPITYKLDNKFNLPRNPMGRTGLCGKGALPRWGPNHNVFAIITRWKKKRPAPSESLNSTPDHLEYVELWFMKKQNISLPGGFAWSEKRYEVIQSCFIMDEHSEPWKTSEEMILFFKACAVGLLDSESAETDKLTKEKFTSNLVCFGYMDDQLNTDQAWKEVELWHLHYHLLTNLSRRFKANIRWKLLSEEVFTQLPNGQSVLLQNAMKNMNAEIFDHILNI